MAHCPTAVRDQLPGGLARVGGELIPLLSPETLTRCNGKVADLRGRIRHNARMHGLALDWPDVFAKLSAASQGRLRLNPDASASGPPATASGSA